MAQAMPPLRIIAQPRSSYRERYKCELNPRRNRAQRFIHAEENPDKYIYPTIEIPYEWIHQYQQLLHIRLTVVTICSERVPVRCVHPYSLNSEDIGVMKDPSTNSLYFPVSENELQTGRKSLQFTLQKLTHHELKEHGILKLLDSEENDEGRVEDPTDAKKIIETYQLGQSQLLFSIATFPNNSQLPVTYTVSSVLSHIMTGMTTTTNGDDIRNFRCSPIRGDYRGGDEILMVIPKKGKRKDFSVRFIHQFIDPRISIDWEFVDAKTISFYTPPCPIILTKDNPTCIIPIVVSQGNTEIARVDFVYQSLDKCVVCNSNMILTSTPSPTSNKRSFAVYDQNNTVEFSSLTIDRTEKSEEIDHSGIRNPTHTARLSPSIESEVSFSLLDHAIRQDEIDIAYQLIENTNNLLTCENNHGETPLLLAAKFNRINLIKFILHKRPELIKQIDKQGNNLLHLLAAIPENRATKTIEFISTKLKNEIKQYLIRQLNHQRQTPQQIAINHSHMQYINLL